MNPDLLKSNFDRMLLHAGWGDPVDGLWFIGIEEGSGWVGGPEVVGKWFADSAERIQSLAGMTYESGIAAEGLPAARGSKVKYWEQKIVDGLRALESQSQNDVAPALWSPGSKVFHSNLYPLARPRVMSQPPYFATHFGVTDAGAYRDRVFESRFAALQRLRVTAGPQAIVCFGKGFWPEFAWLLSLDPGLAREGGGGNFRYFDEAHVVLAPFFGWWHMSGKKAQDISAKLHEWNVKLDY